MSVFEPVAAAAAISNPSSSAISTSNYLATVNWPFNRKEMHTHLLLMVSKNYGRFENVSNQFGILQVALVMKPTNATLAAHATEPSAFGFILEEECEYPPFGF